MSHRYEVSYDWFANSRTYLITILDLETNDLYESQSNSKTVQNVIYYAFSIIGLLELGNSLNFHHSISGIYTFVPIHNKNYKLSPKLSKLLMETLSLKYSNFDSIFEISEIPDLLEGL